MAKKFMTPREKALELISAYRSQCLIYQQAKQYALIAVEEILKCEPTEPTDTAQYYWPQKKGDACMYWSKVKSELLSF